MTVTKPQLKMYLKNWRSAHGYTQEQAAAVLGVKLSTLRQWERAFYAPTTFAMNALLKTILPEGHSFELRQPSTQEAAKVEA